MQWCVQGEIVCRKGVAHTWTLLTSGTLIDATQFNVEFVCIPCCFLLRLAASTKKKTTTMVWYSRFSLAALWLYFYDIWVFIEIGWIKRVWRRNKNPIRSAPDVCCCFCLYVYIIWHVVDVRQWFFFIRLYGFNIIENSFWRFCIALHFFWWLSRHSLFCTNERKGVMHFFPNIHSFIIIYTFNLNWIVPRAHTCVYSNNIVIWSVLLFIVILWCDFKCAPHRAWQIDSVHYVLNWWRVCSHAYSSYMCVVVPQFRSRASSKTVLDGIRLPNQNGHGQWTKMPLDVFSTDFRMENKCFVRIEGRSVSERQLLNWAFFFGSE